MTVISKVMTTSLSIVLSVGSLALAADEAQTKVQEQASPTQVSPAVEVKTPKLYAGFTTQEEQVCYIAGCNLASQVKAGLKDPDVDMLTKGIDDLVSGKELAIPKTEYQAIMEKFAAIAGGDDKASETKLKDYAGFNTDQQKVSYVIGVSFADSIAGQPFKVSTEKLIGGVKDCFTDPEKIAIPLADHQAVMMAFRETLMAKMEKERQDKINAVGWKMKLEKPALMSFDAAKDYFWVLETNKGTVKVKLWPDVAPMHVTSTIFLTNKTFYDGLTFHRVIPGFMAQGGCPLGDGTGNPGYEYESECKDTVKHDKPYLLSMANAGPGTDGSQFFITFAPTPHLDGKHTLFGEVVEGKEVMASIEKLGSQSGKTSEPVSIVKATIVETAKN